MYYNDIWYFFSKSTHVSTPLLPWDPAPGPPVKQNRFALFWRARTFSYGNRSIFPEHKALMEEPIPKPLVVEEPPDFVSMKVSHMKQLRYQSSSYVHGLMSFLCREEQIIFNPSIGKSMTLPTIKTSGIISQCFLGYDPINAQYKVLCFISTNVTRFCEHHQVLTLGAQNCSWRMIQCRTPHYRGESSMCIDGILYYKAFTMNETVLVRFDLKSECLEVASKFPEGLKSSNEINLINYQGKVAVVSKYHHNEHHNFNLWVLEDAKTQQWSKELVFFHTGVTGKFHGDLEILGTSDMGEIVFAPKLFKEFVVYFLDHKTNRIRSVVLEGNTKYKFRDYNIVVTFLHYVESVMFI